MKIDFKWGENYPEEAPEFGLESFYNTHLTDATKEYILEFLSSQAEENLGKFDLHLVDRTAFIVI